MEHRSYKVVDTLQISRGNWLIALIGDFEVVKICEMGLLLTCQRVLTDPL
jgi:hypothetical protein